ncbi:MAG: S-methyl-5'-thioadenosine phosphorylase [Microcoleaceae cyanobacterium]
MSQIRIGIIGGSGLYKMDALKDIEEKEVPTPLGSASDKIIIGTLDGIQVAFLARHGRTHHLLPTEVPYRANIYALKSLGVEYIISASAVGSLKENVKPLDMVLPDQFIDRTQHRVATFFGEGVVAHIAFGHPICAQLTQILAEAIQSLELEGIDLHVGGTYVCMEGPAFSTQAESELYRSWNGTVIGMTNLTEAKLAREAEMAYASLSMVTDYDCWHPDHDSVTVEMIVGNLQKNAVNAQRVIRAAVQRIGQDLPESEAHSALKNSILTPLNQIPPERLEKLEVILKKYLP